MIRHLAKLDAGATIHAEVGVIGAGLAGIDAARHLGRQGIGVALLESGRLEFDPAIQDLASARFAGKPLRTRETHGHITPYLPPMYRGYPRIRQFGGTTSVWTGKWRIFDPEDFERRDWIAHSGWPIGLDALLPFYRETAADYGFGDFDRALEGEMFRSARDLLAPYAAVPHLFYWEKTPTRSGTRFFQELKGSPHVDVLLGATATEILLDDTLRTVRAIRVKSLDGRAVTLCAKRFVLATGGLEAPRLLLASNGQIAKGIGNGRDLVGRFYMDHPKHKNRSLQPGRAMRRLLDAVKFDPRPRFGLSFSLSPKVQCAEGLPNHALYLKPMFGRFGRISHYRAKIGIEQLPNPDSRIHLAAERDPLGVQRLVVDWRFVAADHDGFAAVQAGLARAFAAAGLGRLDFGERPLTLDEMMDGSHHMGTTRMAAAPSAGVVDADCKVFGTDNLYIASSAVFATGHAYSPTFTILALARRLAHHLADLRARDQVPVPAGDASYPYKRTG